jgi:phage baseplate assembly protein W
MSDWYGINYPFKGGIQNVLSRQIGTRIIKNDLLQLIFTNPGERVYRPDYGIGIRTYLYEQLDNDSLIILETNIREQISIYETRVSLDQLEITPKRDKNKLDILMVFSLIQSPNEIFEINLNLPIFEEAA